MALHTVGSIQLLSCARGQATTISVLQDFAKKPENLFCLLQEPWCNRYGHPPLLPQFNTFTPTPTKPKYVTYVRQLPGLTASTFSPSRTHCWALRSPPHGTDKRIPSLSSTFTHQDARSLWLHYSQHSLCWPIVS